METVSFGGRPSLSVVEDHSQHATHEKLRFRRSNSAHFRSITRCYVEEDSPVVPATKPRSMKNCTAAIDTTPSPECSDSWATPVASTVIRSGFSGDSNNYRYCEIKGGEPGESSLFKRRSASIPSLLDYPVGNAFVDGRDEDVLQCSPPLSVVGLQNLGYTCYQNAVIQCLYFTKNFKEYIVSGGSEDLGNGILLKRLGRLMKSISREKLVFSNLHKFRSAVGSKLQQFSRVEQHDAQEFLLTLLDSLHCECVEGLKANIVSKEPHEKLAVGDSKHPAAGLMESFVTKLFQGQFCSSVVCNGCGYCSTTFESFTGLSLPIPKLEIHSIQVSIVYRTKMADRKNSTHSFTINSKMTACNLKQIIAFETGMEEASILLCDMSKNTFGMLLRDKASAGELLACESLHAFEAPCYKGQEAVEPVLLLLANKVDKRFGQPLVLRVRRNLTQAQFQSVVLNAMKEQLKVQPKDFMEVITSQTLFQCKVVTNNNKDGLSVLKDTGKGLFNNCTVDAGLHEADVYNVNPHLRLLAEWSSATKDSLFEAVLPCEIPLVTASSTTQRRREKYAFKIPLEECIQSYFQKEHVSGVEWKCPKCSCVQSEIVKKFDFCSLPNVLIVSVKRFQQHYNEHTKRVVGTKLNTLVEFPLDNLDMSSYMWEGEAAMAGNKDNWGGDTGGAQCKNPKEKEKKSKSKGKKFLSKLKVNMGKKSPLTNEGVGLPPQCSGDQASSTSKSSSTHGNPTSSLYDLYAVINHKGTMESGHYTAMCKNLDTNLWYHCDDSRVKEISCERVLSENAYILFYARKDTISNQDSDDQSSVYSSSTDNTAQLHFTIDALSSSDTESRVSVSSNPRSQPDSRSQSVQSHFLIRPWSTSHYNSSPEPWTPKLSSPIASYAMSPRTATQSKRNPFPHPNSTSPQMSPAECTNGTKIVSRSNGHFFNKVHSQREEPFGQNASQKPQVDYGNVEAVQSPAHFCLTPTTGVIDPAPCTKIDLIPVMSGTLV